MPPAQAFEAIVRRLDLMHHATKKYVRSKSNTIGQSIQGAHVYAPNKLHDRRRRPRVGPGADVGRDSKGMYALTCLHPNHPPSSRLPTRANRTNQPASTEKAEARVGEALQSVEEAMRELLIAADLVHVIRGGGAGGAGAAASFIGQDKIADTAALGLAARGMQQVRGLCWDHRHPR